MTNNPELQRFREMTWRGPLTAAEQAELEAFLKANPAARDEWEAELALSTALDGLTDPPISSNFTALVLQAIERETRAAESAVIREPWWRRMTHRTAWAWTGGVAALIVIGGLFLHQRQHELAKQDLVKSAILVSAVSALPNTEVLTNFEAIRAMSAAPAPDEKLLAVLQ